jgi:putative endonuclease
VRQLVHVEMTSDVRAAIAREKQIKGWSRAKKLALIEENNPQWIDLAASWIANSHLSGR